MNQKIYLDFDGVILNTQDKIDYLFSKFNNEITPEWNEYLTKINWRRDILPDSKEINNSLGILKELYKMKKDIIILSRVFSSNEYIDKFDYLRDRGIYLDFIPAFGRRNKSEYVKPDKNKILIDDSGFNVKEWIDNNGRGIFFTNNIVDLAVSNGLDFNDKLYYQANDDKTYFKETTSGLSFLLKKKI